MYSDLFARVADLTKLFAKAAIHRIQTSQERELLRNNMLPITATQMRAGLYQVDLDQLSVEACQLIKNMEFLIVVDRELNMFEDPQTFTAGQLLKIINKAAKTADRHLTPKPSRYGIDNEIMKNVAQTLTTMTQSEIEIHAESFYLNLFDHITGIKQVKPPPHQPK